MAGLLYRREIVIGPGGKRPSMVVWGIHGPAFLDAGRVVYKRPFLHGVETGNERVHRWRARIMHGRRAQRLPSYMVWAAGRERGGQSTP